MQETSINALNNLRGSAPFAELAGSIAMLADRPLDFFASPGNWGDALINVGSRQFFTDNGFGVRELRRADLVEDAELDVSDRVAIVGGGGGWNQNWNSTIAFVEEASRRYHHVVVLPSSYDYDMLGDFDRKRVTLFTRAADAEIAGDTFCHDMAFYCQTRAMPSQLLGNPLIAFRRDKERSAQAFDPDRNWDLSLLGTAETDPREFLLIVNRFRTIFTDRLHIAIAGAMLGRNVLLLDGNYRKNEGVFRASLEPNYPNVSLVSWAEVRAREVNGFEPMGDSGYPARD